MEFCRPPHDEKGVAAFPGRRLRHVQRQGSAEDELKRSQSRVQVELQFKSQRLSRCGGFGSPRWKCRNLRTPFASSNLARSANRSACSQTGLALLLTRRGCCVPNLLGRVVHRIFYRHTGSLTPGSLRKPRRQSLSSPLAQSFQPLVVQRQEHEMILLADTVRRSE